jgi:hypothetical protein
MSDDTTRRLEVVMREEGKRFGLLDTAVDDALLSAQAEEIPSDDWRDVRDFLRAKVETKPHWFGTDHIRYRSTLSPQDKARLIGELGQAGYAKLPWDAADAERQKPKRDAKGKFIAKLRRSEMSPREKAAYISQHGGELYLKLPW